MKKATLAPEALAALGLAILIGVAILILVLKFKAFPASDYFRSIVGK